MAIDGMNHFTVLTRGYRRNPELLRRHPRPQARLSPAARFSRHMVVCRRAAGFACRGGPAFARAARRGARSHGFHSVGFACHRDQTEGGWRQIRFTQAARNRASGNCSASIRAARGSSWISPRTSQPPPDRVPIQIATNRLVRHSMTAAQARESPVTRAARRFRRHNESMPARWRICSCGSSG